MDKYQMREWVASLEAIIDNKLKKWLKENPHSDGDVSELRWTFENTHIHLHIFWPDGKELVVLKYSSPRTSHEFKWHGLNDKTFNKVQDRVGNLAQVTMYPPIDPTD